MSILDGLELEESNMILEDNDEYENFGECIMTIENFINSCEHNWITSCDGYGELLNNDMSKTGILISPSEYRDIPEGYIHIAWYNK